jgi:hypothetical protein
VDGDQAAGQRSAELVQGYLTGSHGFSGTGGNRWTTTEKRILRSHIVAQVALAYDLAYGFWSDDFRQGVAAQLFERAREQLDDQRRSEFNDIPSSNHFTLCLGAGGLALLATAGDPGAGDTAELEALARYQLQRHLSHPLGPGRIGYGGEGASYSQYGRAHLWLWLRALQLVRGEDWSAEIPHLADLSPWRQRLVDRVADEPLIAAYGPYAWTGRQRPGHNPFALALPLQKDSATWTATYQQLFDGPSLGLHEAYEIAPLAAGWQDGGTALSAEPSMFDETKGWYSFRGKAGSVATVYAKHASGGGWSFSETAGIRLVAHGTHWARRAQGGQGGARGRSDWMLDNVVTVPEADGWLGTQTLHVDQRGTVVLDTSPAYARRIKDNGRRRWQSLGIHARRLVHVDHGTRRQAWSWSSSIGFPVLLLVRLGAGTARPVLLPLHRVSIWRGGMGRRLGSPSWFQNSLRWTLPIDLFLSPLWMEMQANSLP